MTRLKREAKELKRRAISGVLLAIEHFNRPIERGRSDAVFMFLQYGFEMLLKAAILQKRGTIHEKGIANSYPFKKCIGIARSDLHIVSESEARTLGVLTDLRDCSMHYYHVVSEDLLYQQIQSGILLFDNVLCIFCDERLADHLPTRVLPISVMPLMDVQVLMDREFSQIREMLKPGKRRNAEAAARLRPLLIMEANVVGNGGQPSGADIARTIKDIRNHDRWETIFPGIDAFAHDPTDPKTTYSIRLTKAEGLPVRKASDDDAIEDTVAYREYNFTDRWSLNEKKLIERTGIGQYDVRALVYHLNVKEEEDLYKEWRIDSTLHKHYSAKAVDVLKQAFHDLNMEEIREKYKRRHFS